MAFGKAVQEYNWNANAGIIEEIVKQVELVRTALSQAEAYEALQTLQTFYDLATVKVDSEQDAEFDELVNSCSGLLLQLESGNNKSTFRSQSIALNKKLHEMNRWILRLMVRNKLIKLDADTLDPIKEVENDY